MISSRTYLLRNQIHDLVKFFQANKKEFMIPEVLQELKGTEDQKVLMLKIFDLLSKETIGGGVKEKSFKVDDLKTQKPATTESPPEVKTLLTPEEEVAESLLKTLDTKKNTSKKVKADGGEKSESD